MRLTETKNTAILLGLEPELQDKLSKIVSKRMGVVVLDSLNQVKEVWRSKPEPIGSLWINLEVYALSPEWVKQFRTEFPQVEVIIIVSKISNAHIPLLKAGVFGHVQSELPKGQVNALVLQLIDEMYGMAQLKFWCELGVGGEESANRFWQKLCARLRKSRETFKPAPPEALLSVFPENWRPHSPEKTAKPTILVMHQGEIAPFKDLKKIFTLYCAHSEDQISSLLAQKTIDVVLVDLSERLDQEVEWMSLVHQKYPDVPKIGVVHSDILAMLPSITKTEFSTIITTIDLDELLLFELNKAIQQRYIEATCWVLYYDTNKDHLAYTDKISMLEKFYDAQRRHLRPTQMADIYRLFPDLQQTGIPEGLHIPEQTVSNGIEPFVSALYENLTQFNPNAEV